jgi:tetrahydromethanopterin S-methyltransferase subunit G
MRKILTPGILIVLLTSLVLTNGVVAEQPLRISHEQEIAELRSRVATLEARLGTVEGELEELKIQSIGNSIGIFWDRGLQPKQDYHSRWKFQEDISYSRGMFELVSPRSHSILRFPEAIERAERVNVMLRHVEQTSQNLKIDSATIPDGAISGRTMP